MSSTHSRLALGTLAILTIAVACGRSGVPGGTNPSDDDDDGGTVRSLTVEVEGNGRPYSVVRSVPAGISCPGVCSANFPMNSAVALTASSGTATFIDWTGGCAANAGPDCALVLSSNLTTVARLATSGSVVWAQLFGPSGAASGQDVVVATNGDAVTGGTFVGSGTFGSDVCALSSTGGADVFVVRHAPNGTCTWATRMGGTDDDRTLALAGSEDGLFAVRGDYLSPLFYTSGADLTKNGIGIDAFTVLLTGDAQVLWSLKSPETNRRTGRTACFGSEDVLFTGDATDLNGDGDRTVFYYRIAPTDPDPLTSRNTSRNGMNTFDALPTSSACAAGALFLTGTHDPNTNQGLSFPGAGALSVPGGGSAPDDVWLARITTSGSVDVVWTQRFGGPGNQESSSVAANPSGELVVALDVDDDTVIGGASVPSADVSVPFTAGNALDIVLARLDPDGNVKGAWIYGSLGDQSVGAVTFAGSDGGMIIVGTYEGAAFELAPSPAAGGDDLFVARLDTSGAAVWTRKFGGESDDEARSVAIRGKHLYLTGLVSGSTSFDVETFVGPVSLAPVDGSDVLLMRLVP